MKKSTQVLLCSIYILLQLIGCDDLPSDVNELPVNNLDPAHEEFEFEVVSVTPKSSKIGDILSIKGTWFSEVEDSNKVYFGLTEADIIEAKEDELKVLVPDNIRSFANLLIESPYGSVHYKKEFEVIRTRITHINEEIVIPGDLIKIYGYKFSKNISEVEVKIGGINAQVLEGNEHFLNVQIPSNINYGSNDIEITTEFGSEIKKNGVVVLRNVEPVFMEENNNALTPSNSYSTVQIRKSSYLDDDPYPDLISFSPEYSFLLFRNKEGVDLESKLLENNYAFETSPLIVFDINDEGNLDIIGYHSSVNGRYIRWLENLGDHNYEAGNLHFESGEYLSINYIISDLDSYDYDLDGDLDLIISTNDGIYIAQNVGNGTFKEEIISIETGSKYDSIFLLDMNHDGILDIVAPTKTSYNISIATWINNEGEFSKTTFLSTLGIDGELNKFHKSDLNKDGYMDVIVNFGNYLMWFLAEGNGVYKSNRLDDVDVNDFLISDFNGDGTDDLLIKDDYSSSTNYLLLNDGNGNFTDKYTIDIDLDNTDLVTAIDMDNDGDLDIIYNNGWVKNTGF